MMAGDLPPSSSTTGVRSGGGRRHDLATDPGAAGEGELVDPRVAGQRLRRLDLAVHQVDHPGRHARLVEGRVEAVNQERGEG